MEWIVCPSRRQIVLKEYLEEKYKIELDVEELVVEAEDRWAAVVRAYLEWKLEKIEMQELFNITSVRKAKKRYEKGWERDKEEDKEEETWSPSKEGK